MKQNILTTIILTLFSNCFSQNYNTTYQDALAIKNRILLVVMPENSKMIIRDYEYEDSTFAKMYKVNMEGQRIAFKNVVLNNWTFSDSVQIVSSKEAKSLQRKNPEKYAILKIGENTQDRVYIHSQPEPPQVAWFMENNRFVYYYDRRYNLKMLGITTLVIELPKKAIEVFLPKMSASIADFIYGLNQINFILSNSISNENNTSKKLFRSLEDKPLSITNKTLVLDIQEINCSYEEIKEHFNNEVRIVSYPDLAKIITNKDTNSTIITTTRIDPHRTCYILSNAGNGKIYYKFEEPTFNYGESKGYSIEVLYPFITVNHIRKFSSNKK